LFQKWQANMTIQPSGIISSRTAIDTLAWLIHDAFEGDPDQSLLANLRDLSEKDWTALPVGGGRSIADILEHVGWAKWMYEDYAFGSASMRGDQPPLIPINNMRSRPPDELLAINDALDKFVKEDPAAAELVKLRYFVGMTMEEAAAALNLSQRSAERLWSYSKAWLKREVSAK